MNEIVKQWLESSDGDLRAMETLQEVGGGMHVAACFHAQQCVEKLMKAVLIAGDADAPKIHDLVTLSRLVRDLRGWTWDEGELDDLSRGAVTLRYPLAQPDEEEAARLAEVCRRVRPPLLALLDPPAS